MSFEVLLTEDAQPDPGDICSHILEHDGEAKVDHVLKKIDQALEKLAQNPQRSSHPKELVALGIRDYRQIFFKPYRVIYRVVGRLVYVLMLACGQRDMQTLLAHRLVFAE
ncbi:MAG: type II toxin-antitoxin system RelE/ParE family toxin [Acidiferrobacterales bacterium]